MFLSDRREYQVFKELLRTVPGLETRVMEASEQEIIDIADLVSDSPSSPSRIRSRVTKFPDPKRRQWCPGRRHEGDEDYHRRLDHPDGAKS
jgi:hypothetical protein